MPLPTLLGAATTQGIVRVQESVTALTTVNLTQVGGVAVTLGTKASAASIPVVLASDQAAIPVSQSGAWTVTANAGANLNTSALALETGGNLATLAGAVTAARVIVRPQVNDGTGAYADIRTPSILRGGTATASGNTAVWTPAGGKKFRLLAFRIDVTAEATLAAGADLTLKLQDAAVDLGTGFAWSCYVPAAAITGPFGIGFSTGWIDLKPNGYLSSAINQALNVNLSAALTAGKVNVVAIGTEE